MDDVERKDLLRKMEDLEFLFKSFLTELKFVNMNLERIERKLGSQGDKK